MKTTTKEICYCCERECLPHEGEWIQVFYNEFEHEAFMCKECIEEDEKLCEGHEYQDVDPDADPDLP